MKEIEATNVSLYFGQVEGLKVKVLELKRLEPSTSFTGRDIQKSGRRLWAILETFHRTS